MKARTSARIAWPLGGLSVILGMLSLLLLAVNRASIEDNIYDHWLADSIVAMIFPVVGALIVSRYPGNILGWVFCVAGLAVGVARFASEYANYALITAPGMLPGGVAAAWVNSWATYIGFLSLPFLPLLFPDGRPPSRRWRPVAWLAASAVVLVAVSRAFMPGPLEEHPSVNNPLGVAGTRAGFELLIGVGATLFFVCLFASVVALVLRFRRSRGDERQQLKWFAYAAALMPVSFIANDLFPNLVWLIGGVWATFIPVAIGVAILKYRLWDIDPIINCTLVYGALTACVVGVYVLVVGGLGTLLQTRDSLLISLLGAGMVAVLFAPLRDRLQRGVNRLMYGERDDPYAVISRLGERLEGTLAPEAALETIAETVAGALKLPYAVITLKRDREFIKAAEYGNPTGEPIVLPLTHQGESVGQLVLAPRSPGEQFSAADKRLLEDLARQAGVAAYAVRLTADLQRSRERLVTAREEERRRLRRDLHDGLGPQLAAQTLKLGSARSLYSRDPAAADALLSELEADIEAAVSDIRRLVYELRPPALDDVGLAGAIRDAADQYGTKELKVSVDAPKDLPSLPAAVEVAAYRIAQEALTNVVRHAAASVCAVRLSITDDTLELEVSDDGVGLSPDRPAGVGLSSMRERAEELGGACEIGPSPSGGARVLARLPLPEDKEE